MCKILPLLIISSFFFGSCKDCEQNVVHEIPYFNSIECLGDEDIVDCGTEEMLRFLYANLVYPQVALLEMIEGDVVVQFQIGINGNTINHEVIMELGYGCDEEAVRLVKLMTFIPGKNECGDIIESTMSLYVRFRL